MNESNLYGKDLDYIAKRTDNIRQDIKQFLLNVVKREELFKVKVDCIQKNVTSSFEELGAVNHQINQTETESVIFTFQINNCFVFNKALREVEKFCKDIAAEIKNPLIQPMNDLFNFCYTFDENSNTNNSRITSQHDFPRYSGNIAGQQFSGGNNDSRRYKILY